jgi:hypothetical protein
VLLAQPSKKGEGVQAKLIDLGGVADLNADVREDEAIFDPTYGAPSSFPLTRDAVCYQSNGTETPHRSGERRAPLQQHSQHQHHIQVSSKATQDASPPCVQ